MRMLSLLTIAFVALFANSSYASLIVIDNGTQGYYNAGLGDLSLDSVLGMQTDTATGLRLFPAANVAGGDPLIPMSATQPNLGGADAATQAALGNFLGNTTALGGTWSVAPQAIPGTWTVNDETAIVYVVDAGAGLNNVSVSLGVDNGFFAWLNGAYVTGALAPGGAPAGEYVFSLGHLTGVNYLQFLREDHGGATGWTIQVTGTPVPEPHTMALLGLGILAAGAFRRRQTRAGV